MLTLIGVFVGGCVTSGNYCDVARPIRPSLDDAMTPETQRQILIENTKLHELCGVKP